MLTKITLFPLPSIAFCICLHAMQPSEIAERFKTIPKIEQKKNQEAYQLWQKLTFTPEFANCINLLKNNSFPSPQNYEKAFIQLHATQEYQTYKAAEPSITQKIKK